ncbi:hypothetical protein [Streptomyces erythrochromogenes]|uniref:hypothetical protein n=1 Tax=Streptomyces erythrochromogenes TaxID=285574 RepID=UPI0033D0C193
MHVAGRPVGLLHLTDTDMFWYACRFEPLEGWDAVRPLFDARNEIAAEGFPPERAGEFRGIRDRGVELRPTDGGARSGFTPFMIYVEGERARFRR